MADVAEVSIFHLIILHLWGFRKKIFVRISSHHACYMPAHLILLVEVAPVIGPICRRVKRIIIATDKNKNTI